MQKMYLLYQNDNKILLVKLLVFTICFLCKPALADNQNEPKLILYENLGGKGGSSLNSVARNYPYLHTVNFNNKAQTACIVGTWIFYGEKNYGSNDYVQAEFRSDGSCLNFQKLSKRISSFRFAGSALDFREDTLDLFYGVLYTGIQFNTDYDIPNITAVGLAGISSLVVHGVSNWTLFENTEYTGRSICVSPQPHYIPEFYKSVSYLGIGERIRSVRKGCSKLVNVHMNTTPAYGIVQSEDSETQINTPASTTSSTKRPGKQTISNITTTQETEKEPSNATTLEPTHFFNNGSNYSTGPPSTHTNQCMCRCNNETFVCSIKSGHEINQSEVTRIPSSNGGRPQSISGRPPGIDNQPNRPTGSPNRPTSRPNTTPRITSRPNTTPRVTNRPNTTPRLTSGETTTPRLTTRPKSTPRLTNRPTTTPRLTSRPKTTPRLTSRPKTTLLVTSEQDTTPKVTSEQDTATKVTSGEDTTPKVTSRPKTSSKPTNEPPSLVNDNHHSSSTLPTTACICSCNGVKSKCSNQEAL